MYAKDLTFLGSTVTVVSSNKSRLQSNKSVKANVDEARFKINTKK